MEFYVSISKGLSVGAVQAGTSLQTCTNIFASLMYAQREKIEQLHVRDVLILVQVWRLVPAPVPDLIQPPRLNLIAPPTHSHEN